MRRQKALISIIAKIQTKGNFSLSVLKYLLDKFCFPNTFWGDNLLFSTLSFCKRVDSYCGNEMYLALQLHVLSLWLHFIYVHPKIVIVEPQMSGAWLIKDRIVSCPVSRITVSLWEAETEAPDLRPHTVRSLINCNTQSGTDWNQYIKPHWW